MTSKSLRSLLTTSTRGDKSPRVIDRQFIPEDGIDIHIFKALIATGALGSVVEWKPGVDAISVGLNMTRAGTWTRNKMVIWD